MLLEVSERYFATRRGAGTEHGRSSTRHSRFGDGAVFCKAFCNEAWARKTLAQPEGYF